MLIKMICFSVTKENLVRETDELRRVVSKLGTRYHSTAYGGRINLPLALGGSNEHPGILKYTPQYSSEASN